MKYYPHTVTSMCTTVSYTHLDVYKRQPVFYAVNLQRDRLTIKVRIFYCQPVWGYCQRLLSAVNALKIDVYKRQHLGVPRSSG